MPDRVVVFLDYQNVYRRAGGAVLLESGPPRHGQVDPLQLGQLIVSRSPFDRELLRAASVAVSAWTTKSTRPLRPRPRRRRTRPRRSA